MTAQNWENWHGSQGCVKGRDSSKCSSHSRNTTSDVADLMSLKSVFQFIPANMIPASESLKRFGVSSRFLAQR